MTPALTLKKRSSNGHRPCFNGEIPIFYHMGPTLEPLSRSLLGLAKREKREVLRLQLIKQTSHTNNTLKIFHLFSQFLSTKF